MRLEAGDTFRFDMTPGGTVPAATVNASEVTFAFVSLSVQA
jgi:hypothetical protein